MSMPFPPPPPATVIRPPETATHGSIGAVIGVLSVILFLCIVAIIIGRLCFGKGILHGSAHYDLESWIESKCSSCVDGRLILSPPPPPPPPPPQTMPTNEGRSELPAENVGSAGN
ncbi:uncharacterized protein LOC130810930 [Amaranthus tricolor]|uniref:uncharacterized protein LOC130810930 n=1 Tax=Amaranthus tricolor TaxID=29722 RepID=UPI002589D5AE|nr:uncharacterized protein LOC130810930 [Amaranthus tricolor]